MRIIRMVNGRIISIPQSFIRFCSQLCLLQWTRQKILPLFNQWSELRSIIKYSSNETHCYTDDEHSKEAHSGMRIYLINIFKDQEKLTRFKKQNWEEWRKDRLQSGCIREEKMKRKKEELLKKAERKYIPHKRDFLWTKAQKHKLTYVFWETKNAWVHEEQTEKEWVA